MTSPKKGHDRHFLAEMSRAAKAALKRDKLHVLADKGHFSGHEILACHEAGIMTTIPQLATSGNRIKGLYVKADSPYEADRDAYR